ncbi:MAG: ABC transporter permease [Trueperaceae bacterium]|nr:ABC transporter permease [Trueperaceae bacterium]
MLTLLQIALAAFVVTVALHALDAERRRIAEQSFFQVSAGEDRGQVFFGTQVFTHAFVRDLLGMAPDVESVAIFGPGTSRQRLEADGQTFMLTSSARVDAAFFDVLGASITRGTPFESGQTRIPFDGILLEDEVANLVFLGADPIGRQVRLLPPRGLPAPPDQPAMHRVVGTFSYPDSLASMLNLPGAVMALPVSFQGSSRIYATPRPGRASAAKEQLLAGGRQLYSGSSTRTDFYIRETDRPGQIFGRIDPQILLFSLFGVTALVLVGVGVFSLTVVDVSEQAHQIGVRRVLGASRWRIAGEYASTAGIYAFVAGIAGALVALMLVPLLQSNLAGGLLPGATLEVRPLLAVATVLVMVVLSAGLGLVPALSAGLERPAVALRER